MAEVYRAKLLNAPHFSRFLAIKRILPNLAVDSEFIRMFIDEAKITVELNHPNICQIYELGRLEDSHYIAMEFIPGRDLLGIQNRYRRQKKIMSVSQACFITAQVAQGLDYAHRAVDSKGRPLRLVHRDVSPQNVLVSYEGLIKLIDFGVAKAASQNSKTQAGVLKGKFGYMSPEQVAGEGEVDHKSDIFALGTVFWELLTGRRLFHGDNEFATLELVRECNVAPPSTLNRLVPPQIESIVMRALCPDPAYRYQWAGEMARDIFAFLNSCNPPYTQWHLQNWMCTNFAEDLEKEWEKLPIIQGINTPEDVFKYNQEQLAAAQARMMANIKANKPVVDFEGNLVPELTDTMDAGGEKTQVFTPEFDFKAKGAALQGQPDQSLPGLPPASKKPPPAPDDVSSPEVSNIDEAPENPLHLSVYQMEALGNHPSGGKSKMGLILGILIAIVLIGSASFLAYYFLELRTPETVGEEEPTAVVDVSIAPESEQAKVRVKPIGSDEIIAQGVGSKLTFDDLPPGKYMFEVERPDFEPEIREVSLREGANTVAIEMYNRLLKTADVTFTIDPPDLELKIDGAIQEGEGAERTLKLESGKTYVIDATRAGYSSFNKEVEVAEEPVAVEIKLIKGEATLTVKARPKATLFVKQDDGSWKEFGETPQTLEELDPTKEYEVEVRKDGYETWAKTIEFSDKLDKRLLAILVKE